MAVQKHYETLGLSQGASPDDIKSAYRRLARKFHPDLNPAPEATEKFLAVQQAYEVLMEAGVENRGSSCAGASADESGVGSRESGGGKDASAEVRKREKEIKEAEGLRLRAEERMRDHAPPPSVNSQETQRLTSLLNANRFAEAEQLAHQMLKIESRQPVPYAVLGDIARIRGEGAKATQYYGYAAQYEPANPVYQKKYEQMLNGQPAAARRTSDSTVPDPTLQPLAVMSFAVLVMAVYVALAPEKPLGIVLAPAWTLGSMVMLFVSGIVVGACLSLSGSLDDFDSTAGSALMKVSPAVSIGIVSVFSFWMACVVYFVIGQTQQAFNRSLSMLLGSVGAVAVVFALAGLAKGPALAMSNLVWGGNLACFGAIIGWYVTDRFKIGTGHK